MSKAIVKQIKQAGEDFEFYPTTREIIEALYWDIKSHKTNHWYGRLEHQVDKYEFQSISLLDIGAGNCKVYKTLQEISEEDYINSDKLPNGSYRNKHERRVNQLEINKYMVIEKSQILIDNMPREAVVIGTNFHENTLIDKQADVVFCNPPYSEYALWMERIIKEANAPYVYFVVPQRWGNNRAIADALKLRKAKVKIVGNFDFLNSEDRKARAKVSLVKVILKSKDRYEDKKVEVDPFDLWFNETFKIQAEKVSKYEFKKREKRAKEHSEKVKNALVNAHDLVGTLVELYNKDLEQLINNYQKVAELDSEILKELNVDVENLLKAFKEKISGLKNLYWQEIFNNLTEITSRLTTSTRQKLLGKLASNTNIDFTQGNIRSVVIWVIKNANQYLNDQLLELYDDLTCEEGIKLYKSNAHFQKDSWRYLKEDKNSIKYSLDYRIVYYSYRNYMDKEGHVSKKHIQLLKDIVVVAKNLGFEIEDMHQEYYLGEKECLYFKVKKERKLKVGQKTDLGKIDAVYEITDKESQKAQGLYQYEIGGGFYHWSIPKTPEDTFVEFRAYKNGNIHLKFNKTFMKKLNLEAGRLKGWIKSPQEAAKEMDISIEEASKWWKSSFTLLSSSAANLLPSYNEMEEEKTLSVEEEAKNNIEFNILEYAKDPEFQLDWDIADSMEKDEILSKLQEDEKFMIRYLLDLEEDLRNNKDIFSNREIEVFKKSIELVENRIKEIFVLYVLHKHKELDKDTLYEKFDSFWQESPRALLIKENFESYLGYCKFEPEEDDKPKKITKENMMMEFAKKLLNHFKSGDVFGGIYDNEHNFHSYIGTYRLFEITKEYRNGFVDGITVLYSRDGNRNVTSFKLSTVFYNKKKGVSIPFDKKNTLCEIDMQDMKKMILDSDDNPEKLQSLLLDFVYTKKQVQKKHPTSLFDFIEDVA